MLSRDRIYVKQHLDLFLNLNYDKNKTVPLF